MALTSYDRVFLRLLKLSPFERRARGGWRFGTRTISDQIVERLIASGRAMSDGETIRLSENAAK
ncbi:MAG: hypothetical protein J0H42_04365 [Rhizobiales bacterium]|nr:hypothetical protein [Hyphomicrobiales bacterium]